MIANTANPQIVAVEPLAVSGADAAKLLGISPRTLRRLDSAGQLPRPVHHGGSKLARRRAVCMVVGGRSKQGAMGRAQRKCRRGGRATAATKTGNDRR